MKLRLRVYSLLLILVSAWIAYGAQNRTYPLSATTGIRMATYEDSIYTIWNSTISEFEKYEDGTTFYLSTGTLEGIKLAWINEILDKDVEQYLVWPATSAPTGWKGWCLTYVNGNTVPAVCIQE